MSSEQIATPTSPDGNIISNPRLATADTQRSAERESSVPDVQSNAMSQTSPASDTTSSRPKKETTMPVVSAPSFPSPTVTAISSEELPLAKPKAAQSKRSTGSVPLTPTTSNEIGVVANPEEFWRRFSMAVHRDEELSRIHQAAGTSSSVSPI
ncbi:hypothetical protein VTN49DRAFT_1945 [Thermomyces lanuginosus]|uniref:uncharacterized protein n=1 Tax=Thermomyces lanuginosus TaxID=5541 RepID=UPI003743EAC3